MAELPANMDYPEAVQYLLGRKRWGVSLGLDRMERFVAAIGSPQERLTCIHVAGTNGKGSVAAMIESIFRAAGWRTGLYTSPHLVRLVERVQINREPILEEELADHVHALASVVEKLEVETPDGGPSYFEFMTGLALRHFDRARCDIAIIEVGLGGRLDATNVILPEVSVITSIGLDHCDVLGNTLAEIAREKAGIIKVGRPVVIGRLPAEAETIVRTIADSKSARVISAVETFGDDLRDYPATVLRGDYQRLNAATATLAARCMPPRWRIGDVAIREGLAAVQWDARWQRLLVEGRIVIVDSSHNAEGAEVLNQSLAALYAETGRRPIIVAGVLGRSRAEAIIPVLCAHAQRLHFVSPAQRRACTVDELTRMVPATFAGTVDGGDLQPVFPEGGGCRMGEVGDVVVVTGSIYLAGEVLSRLDATRGRAETELQDF